MFSTVRTMQWRCCVLAGAAWSVACSAKVAKDAPLPLLAAIDLRVEYAAMPVIGVQTMRPRLSWTLVQPNGVRGTLQSAYRVQVSATAAANVTVWDSSWVASNSTLGIQCSTALSSDTTYAVAVQWKDQVGQLAPTATGSFATALLSPLSDWKDAKCRCTDVAWQCIYSYFPALLLG